MKVDNGMANLSKVKRDRMIEYLKQLKQVHSDDASIIAINEIESALKEKKYGLVWEEHTEEVDDLLKNNVPILCEDKERVLTTDINKDFNFIIQGDNLQALYLLQKTHKGKIDCIYIDPPYNNRARSWKYNNDYVEALDLYKHSKWLSMMKNRLKLAKSLLNPYNSSLIVTIDDKEYLHLGCMLEEMFPSSKITMVSSVINPAGKAKKGGIDFSRTDEYLFFVQIGDCNVIPETREVVKTPIVWETFRRHSLENGRGKHGHGACGPNQFYPIYVDNETHKIVKIGDPIMEDVDRFSVEQIPGCTAVFPVRDDGTEMNWGGIPDAARDRLSKGYFKVGKYSPDKPQQYSIQYLTGGTIRDIESGKIIIEGRDADGCVIGYYPEGRPKVPTTNWNKPSHNATTYGTDILKTMLCSPAFDYPKSLYAVMDCLKVFIANNPNAIVLDYFAGSGTTMHAVHLLNKVDGGRRKCILVTNNEISDAEEKAFIERGIGPEDEEWDNLGIAKHVTWPRCVSAITGKDVKGHRLAGNYGASVDAYVKNDSDEGKKSWYVKKQIPVYPELENIPMAEGFKENLKFYKCEWTPRKPNDYFLSNALCLHIKEMIELKTHRLVDGVKSVLILNKSDFKKYILNNENFSNLESIWVNQNMILDSDELQILNSKDWRYIPNEFFGEELKEAGE